jgi:hypothetical protein
VRLVFGDRIALPLCFLTEQASTDTVIARMTWFRGALFAALTLAACTKAAGGELRSEVPELSGIVASRHFAGVFWGHGDSGNPAAIWAFDREGATLARFEVKARNFDWEDLAQDDQGHLYIGDIGNNLQLRGELTIYVLDEPDPRTTQRTLTVRETLRFRYPDEGAVLDTQMRFDAEALFFSEGHLYLFTKRWLDTRTTLYRLPSIHSGELQVLEHVADLDLRMRDKQKNALVTAADVSADGKRLAILTYARVFVFALQQGRIGKRLWVGNTIGHAGAEAIAWEGRALIVGHEDGTLRRLLPRLAADNPVIPRP